MHIVLLVSISSIQLDKIVQGVVIYVHCLYKSNEYPYPEPHLKRCTDISRDSVNVPFHIKLFFFLMPRDFCLWHNPKVVRIDTTLLCNFRFNNHVSAFYSVRLKSIISSTIVEYFRNGQSWSHCKCFAIDYLIAYLSLCRTWRVAVQRSI